MHAGKLAVVVEGCCPNFIKVAQLLADPKQKPDSDIVIWDGQCRFCRAQVERLARFDGDEQLAYLSLHDSRTSDLCPNLSKQQLLEQMWVVTPEGQQYGGADAARYLSRQLSSLWWLRPLLHIPGSMPLWRWLYRIVANRRYAISGNECDDGSCEIHR